MTEVEKYLALYCRLSKAANGQVETVERQERWGRDYGRQNLPGLPVRVFKDNDKSAFDDDTFRADYDKLRKCVRAGEVAQVWCVEQTRLEANRKRWVELVAEFDDAGIEVIHTNRDGLVRLDEVADIKHILAWHERKRLRERVNDTLADLANEGRPGPGTSFGYRHVKDENRRSHLLMIDEEAEALRWAATAILDEGWADEAVAAEFNRRRLKGRRGATVWVGSAIKRTLSTPTIAGKRVYRGEIVADGDWDPILDEVTWRRLQAVFDQRKERPHRPAKRYLLSGGVASCGLCEHALSGSRKTYNGFRSEKYFCLKNRGGCGGIVAAASGLDKLVTEVFLRHLDSDRFRDQLAASDLHAEKRKRLTDALAGVQTRRRDFARLAALGPDDGGIDEDEWQEMRQTLGAQQKRLMGELADIPAPLGKVDPDAILEAWEDMIMTERRHVLKLHLSQVRVYPTMKRGPSFDRQRVEIYDRDKVQLWPDGP